MEAEGCVEDCPFLNTTVGGHIKFGNAGWIFGAARVVSAGAGRHRLNGQNRNPVAQIFYADAALVRSDLMAVKDPAEHQRLGHRPSSTRDSASQ